MLCECKVYFCWCSQVCPGGWWAGLGIPECDKIPESGAGAGAGPVLALILSSLPVYHQTILASNVKQSRYGYYGNYYGNVNVYHIIGWFVNIACILKTQPSSKSSGSGTQNIPSSGFLRQNFFIFVQL